MTLGQQTVAPAACTSTQPQRMGGEEWRKFVRRARTGNGGHLHYLHLLRPAVGCFQQRLDLLDLPPVRGEHRDVLRRHPQLQLRPNNRDGDLGLLCVPARPSLVSPLCSPDVNEHDRVVRQLALNRALLEHLGTEMSLVEPAARVEHAAGPSYDRAVVVSRREELNDRVAAPQVLCKDDNVLGLRRVGSGLSGRGSGMRADRQVVPCRAGIGRYCMAACERWEIATPGPRCAPRAGVAGSLGAARASECASLDSRLQPSDMLGSEAVGKGLKRRLLQKVLLIKVPLQKEQARMK